MLLDMTDPGSVAQYTLTRVNWSWVWQHVEGVSGQQRQLGVEGP